MANNERPPKRIKYRACDACVASKTRCDDVTQEGCLICRKKGRECSLSAAAISSSAPGPDAASYEDLKKRLEQSEARAWDFEVRLSVLERQSMAQPTAHGPVGSVSLPSTNGTPAISSEEHGAAPREIATRLLIDKYMRSFDEQQFFPVDVAGFPDAIKQGLVTSETVDMAFHLFKHRFSHILPLPTFLVSSTPTPTHPFVVLAILSHTPNIKVANLSSLLDQSIRHVTHGAVDQKVILALLILALAPGGSGESSGLSPLRLISMAYELGRALGKDAISKAGAKFAQRLMDPSFSHILDSFILWEAVKNQYNLMHMLSARFHEPVSTSVEAFSSSPTDHRRQSLDHLRGMAELTRLSTSLVMAIADAEASIIFSEHLENMPNLVERWRVFNDSLPDFVARHPRLEFDARLLAFTLFIRLSAFIRNIPTPFDDEEARKAALTWMVHGSVASIGSALDACVPGPEVPRYRLFILLATIVAGLIVSKRIPGYFDHAAAALNRSEVLMRRLGGDIKRTLEQTISRADFIGDVSQGNSTSGERLHPIDYSDPAWEPLFSLFDWHQMEAL